MLPSGFEGQIAIAVVASIASVVATRRARPSIRLARNLAIFLALSVIFFVYGRAPYVVEAHVTQTGFEIVLAAIAKGAWWLSGAMLLISLVRFFLIFEKMPQEAKLAQDVVVGLIYLGTTLSIVAFVFAVPIGTLIATSGVLAVILGLALQSTLNDVFSGIALNLGRPYSVGDWIVVDDKAQGRVVETNWRATHLLNGTNDLAVIPNSILAKTKLVNFSSPDETHGLVLPVRVAATKSPAKIVETMESVLLSSNVILRIPAPVAIVTAVDNDAVDLDLVVRISSIADTAAAKNEIYDLAFRHTRAAGLKLARPAGSEVRLVSEKETEHAPAHPGTPWRLLNAISLFDTLTEDEKEALARSMTRRTFKKDSIIAEKGAKLQSLMLVRTGVVQVDQPGPVPGVELSRLAPGDCFGERGVLMDKEEPGTIKAVTFVVIYEIEKTQLAAVMHDRPQIAEELGHLLDQRISAVDHLSVAAHGGAENHTGTLADRIRRAFGL